MARTSPILPCGRIACTSKRQSTIGPLPEANAGRSSASASARRPAAINTLACWSIPFSAIFINSRFSILNPQRGQQRPQMVGMRLPAALRGFINRLAHLIDAGGAYHAAGLMEIQAGVVPGQADEIDQAFRFAFQIVDYRFVIDLDEALRRQHRAPMRHQRLIIAVELPQLGLIVAEQLLAGELLA